VKPHEFEDLPVLGALPPAQAAAKLREVGENELASALEAASSAGESTTFGSLQKLLGIPDQPWQHTAHSFGYLAPGPADDEVKRIQHAGTIARDDTLKNTRIKISLDRLRVADYPGSGTHRILFDFYAQNQLSDNVEHLHFNSTFRVREGESAAIVGYPIFVGLNVGTEGVRFKCFTVNVKNDDDEELLGFLESDVFQTGLKLASTAQPAIAPLSSLAVGLTKTIATHNRNVPVQDFYMGLDFSDTATRATLAEGSYIAVQIPETFRTVWDWRDWVYHPTSGQVVHRADPTKLIPYNYLIFGISRYAEP
jgi:hypothetical protein